MKFRGEGGKRSARSYPPKLTADDIPTLFSALTILSARGVETVRRPFLVLVFEEVPEKEYTTNAGQTAMFGDLVESGILPDPDVDGWESWKGRRVAFTKQENTYEGEKVLKLYPVRAESQAETIATIDAAAATKSKSKGK